MKEYKFGDYYDTLKEDIHKMAGEPFFWIFYILFLCLLLGGIWLCN